ncbi:murein hydrolase activator EnvC family protein [Antarcticirhabdus aurantiaca]|uniref:Peptidoglycan DD-metalloendopeptidase family protein n=1 Tax=Antarcticirhabdus aurantiaca TaxID=2606717 RepID=A0ACD4NJH1_9HYPH|nr:peptidoglycan DD-metalloendopeptidase family protein [Antarcticirhabdus aurantiaca]WAJ26964.1 peptidoglycan DD-metalloendopeptidase family protein [Jeongeuplla avenae]
MVSSMHRPLPNEETRRRSRRRRGGAWLCATAFALAAGLPLAALATEDAPAPPLALDAAPAAAPAPGLAALEARSRKTRDELDAIAAEITLGQKTVDELNTEIVALAADREKIRAAMIEAASAQKRAAGEVAAIESRIATLGVQEEGLRASLRERRGLLAEVLGALERMGREPPPALLVRPEDALGSVRSAILLGSVVPGIRSETEALARDLEKLALVRGAIVAEKSAYASQMRLQKEEEARLAALFAEKEALEATSRDRREAAQQRTEELAGQATDLEGLIASLETELDAARAAEAASRLEEEARRVAQAEAAAQAQAQAEAAERLRLAEAGEARRESVEAQRRSNGAATPAAEPPQDVAALVPPAAAVVEPAAPPPAPTYDIASLRRDIPHLEPAAAFSTLKARLTKPVAGRQIVAFGDKDDIGQAASGASFATRAGDVVTAPADGTVLYSGPFRSYGQVLILNAGDGYHVVLAGMSRIDAGVGQFVLAGEPVAAMGDRRLASVSGSDFDATEPTLYVEFRKDGKPIDPSPWWTVESSGRTRNDS